MRMFAIVTLLSFAVGVYIDETSQSASENQADAGDSLMMATMNEGLATNLSYNSE